MERRKCTFYKLYNYCVEIGFISFEKEVYNPRILNIFNIRHNVFRINCNKSITHLLLAKCLMMHSSSVCLCSDLLLTNEVERYFNFFFTLLSHPCWHIFILTLTQQTHNPHVRFFIKLFQSMI